MTAIAYKDGRMACDSLCADTYSGEVWYKGNKITRTKAGALVGCSGAADARAVIALLQTVKRGNQMPSAQQFADTHCESENGILIALPDGEVWSVVISTAEDHPEVWGADCCKMTGMGGFAAVGCGGGYAMSAMKSGKSAREAVAVACEMSAFCRPPIYEEVLHPDKVKKPRTGAKAHGNRK